MSERIAYMPSLPSTFKSLVGKTVTLETTEARCVIELLGDFLGVVDYETNEAAFWFLDTIALQVLRYRDNLDDHYRSVLISWLAGEMKLIRDKKLSREDFFEKMRALFLRVAEEISVGDRLLHWELLVDECSNILSDPSIDESIASRAKYLITSRSSEELTPEDAECTSRESQLSFAQENFRSRDYRNSAANNLSEESSGKIPLTEDADATIRFFDITTPNAVLDIIIDATYNMYANELRYALVYAVFVTQIKVRTFCMPHTLRVPREIKLADFAGAPFDVQLRERLEKSAIELTSGTHSGKRQTKKNRVKNKQAIDELDTTVPRTPPSSLNEDEALADNRRFILPLIEAKEATQIFETHTGNTQ